MCLVFQLSWGRLCIEVFGEKTILLLNTGDQNLHRICAFILFFKCIHITFVLWCRKKKSFPRPTSASHSYQPGQGTKNYSVFTQKMCFLCVLQEIHSFRISGMSQTASWHCGKWNNFKVKLFTFNIVLLWLQVLVPHSYSLAEKGHLLV